LPSLDEYNKFIETKEGNTASSGKTKGNGVLPKVRYVLRNGITVTEPINEGETTSVGAEGNANGTNGVSETMSGMESDAEDLAMWRRLPRHIQLLASISDVEEEEVARKYYTRDFKETRQQLIQRLLNPTLTLEETARVLGVCPATVRRYTNRGVLPHYRTVGQQRRFRLSDVLVFLERQEQHQSDRRKRGRKAAV
jgi:excisionase family DNA binding protein